MILKPPGLMVVLISAFCFLPAVLVFWELKPRVSSNTEAAGRCGNDVTCLSTPGRRLASWHLDGASSSYLLQQILGLLLQLEHRTSKTACGSLSGTPSPSSQPKHVLQLSCSGSLQTGGTKLGVIRACTGEEHVKVRNGGKPGIRVERRIHEDTRIQEHQPHRKETQNPQPEMLMFTTTRDDQGFGRKTIPRLTREFCWSQRTALEFELHAQDFVQDKISTCPFPSCLTIKIQLLGCERGERERERERENGTGEEGKSRLQQTQDKVEQVTVIMLDNKRKAEERSGNLGDLEQQAEDLLEKSKVFEKTTRKLKQQKEISDKKPKKAIIVSVVAGLIILGLIIFVLINFAG
ncbi:hypothetical protein CCH79_00009915 [Gambusia affinis]|uniref:V-SNARE coiled-coil homology domain-containing protein n=1 Tax=Gambusia affinis TaxID=33528 RepID=A0A315V6P9_GAMAF|nr:hypothetical protein CCH79_00009915 [Gambusia affinis]